MRISPTHFRFSVDDYERMIETGILTEDDPTELIRGEILTKLTRSTRHISSVIRLTHLFTNAVDNGIVSIQNPIRLEDSEPAPDVAILKWKDDYYRSGKARGDSVLLVLEVADISLEFDRTVKRALYAENGIGDCWIVNLIEECVEVYREPQPDGTYASSQLLSRGQSINPLAFPELSVAVSDIV